MDNKKNSLLAYRKKIQEFSFYTSDKIGNGYSSCVYSGKNDTNNQQVAIKVIDMNKLRSANKKLLISEIAILRQIGNCPNLLNIHQIYTTKNNTYIVSELCSTDLHHVLLNKHKFQQEEAIRYMQQLLDAYHVIYKLGIVHRDLKPANILVTENGTLKIADFGFAIKNEELVSPCNYNVGSPLYMAPQSLKSSEYSYKSDIWSLGVIFYELLTGETPWRSKNEKELEWKINNENIQKKLIGKAFSPLAKQFLIRTLKHNKEERITPRQIIKFNFLENNIPNIININNPSQAPTNDKFIPRMDKKLSCKTSSSKDQISQKRQISANNIYKNNPQEQVQKKTSINQSCKKLNNIKSASKILVAEIHFCRFLYKMLNKLKALKKSQIFADLTNQMNMIRRNYVQIIRRKITDVVYFKFNNFLGIDQHDEYIQTKTFQSIEKIAEDYLISYQSDLSDYWNCYLENKNQDIYEGSSTTHLIQILRKRLQIQIPSEQCFDKELFRDQIVMLDYLMTCKQLIELANDNDYEKFSRKSKIEAIVQGKTAQMDYTLFGLIIRKAHRLVGNKVKQALIESMKGPFQQGIYEYKE